MRQEVRYYHITIAQYARNFIVTLAVGTSIAISLPPDSTGINLATWLWSTMVLC